MSRKRHTPADERFFVVRSLWTVLPHGHAIEPHAHSWHQLIYTASGIMTVSADKGLWVVPPRWAIWAPAGIAHAIRFDGAAEFATLYFRPDGREALPASSTAVTVSPLLRALILRACEERMLDERNPVHAATALLIVDALRAEPARALSLPMPASEDLKRVAAYCDANTGGTGASIARRYGMSVRTLERRFVDETGMTFGQWRRHARFLRSLRLLGDGQAVKSVAREAGYRSESAFVAAFSATFGTTPGRYFADA